ncbi:hypothetical protein L2E82_50881 [Cichorium intybus]|nr:hypothetical protein L2E82_50881 [Cichorium intybus]
MPTKGQNKRSLYLLPLKSQPPPPSSRVNFITKFPLTFLESIYAFILYICVRPFYTHTSSIVHCRNLQIIFRRLGFSYRFAGSD